MTDEKPAISTRLLIEFLCKKIPQARDLGMDVVSIQKAKVCVKVPYKDFMVGNIEDGLIHGGIITTLIDNASGLAAASALPKIETVATLDLRMDYMRPAVIDHDIYANAECYRLTQNIAFVKAIAYQDDIDKPVAVSSSTFMRASTEINPLQQMMAGLKNKASKVFE